MIDNVGLVYNSPSPSSRVMTSLIEVGGERRSHANFSDDVNNMSWDTACQGQWPIHI